MHNNKLHNNKRYNCTVLKYKYTISEISLLDEVYCACGNVQYVTGA
jgi:hypothetical protein